MEAGQCFCSLYDKVCWPEALALAYQKAKANKGAPGVGGVTFDEIESYRPVTSTRSVSRAVGSVDLRHRQRHADESQASKAALRSLDLTELLVMSTRTHKPKVSTRLTQVFPPGAPIEEDERAPVPDWDLVQEAHAELLEASAAEVRRVDKAHRLNKVKLSERRRQRVKLVEELSTRHQDLRHSFSGTYGKDALPLVGLDATPERRFVAVREQQLEILERMRNSELSSSLPEPRAGQAPLDLSALADALETGVLELEEAMAANQGMRKEVDDSQVVKRETEALEESGETAEDSKETSAPHPPIISPPGVPV